MPRYNPPEKKKFEPKTIKEYEESRGLGDTVSKFLKKASFGKVKECLPCKKRKEKLNQMFPYKNNDNRNQN